MPRRPTPRRRRALAYALAVSVLVVVVDLAVTAFSEDGNRPVAYLDAVGPLLDDSLQQGRELADLRAGAGGLDRVTFDRRLEQLAAGAEATRDAVAELDPPGDLRIADAHLLSALSLRAGATAVLRDELGAVLSGADFDAAVAALGQAGWDLDAADRAHALFVADAVRVAPEVPVAEVRWLDDPAAWVGPPLAEFVTSLRANPALASVRDVGVVAVALEPPALAIEGDVAVLATDEVLDVTVIVANRGSSAEAGIVVEVVLTVEGSEPQVLAETVDLDPAAQRSLRLSGLVPAVGQAATLEVRVAPVPDETATADNTVVRRLRVRAPGETTTTTDAPPAAG